MSCSTARCGQVKLRELDREPDRDLESRRCCRFLGQGTLSMLDLGEGCGRSGRLEWVSAVAGPCGGQDGSRSLGET